MGQSISGGVSVVADSASSQTLRLTMTYYSSATGVWDTTNTFALTGNWPNYSGSVSIDVRPTGDGVNYHVGFYIVDLVVAKNYGASQSKTWAASLTGINYWPGTVYADGSATVPARAYSAPAAPTLVTGTRVSDTQITVGWTNNSTGGSTTSAPYTTQNVQRRVEGGAWATIASGISGSAVSYSDTTASANHKYEYRIQGVNSTATTTSVESAAVYTTPGTPTSPLATKDASNNIVIGWANNCPYSEHETEIWESQNGGAYALLTTKAAGIVTHTHISPSTAVTHRYQMRHKTTVGTALYSGYATTGTITLASPPNAPTGLTSTPNPSDKIEGGDVFSWTHNATDSSLQSAYQAQVRVVGDVSWVVGTKTTSGTSSGSLATIIATLAPVNGEQMEWQVRTWGQATTGGSEGTGASVYSATSVHTYSARPTVAISSPADASVVVVSTATVAWTYFDAEGSAQAGWQAFLVSGGSPLEVKSGTGATASTTFATPILDGETYSIEVTVQDGVGLWSTVVDTTFTVDYLPPANIAVETIFNPDNGMIALNLVPEAPVGGVTVAATTADIERRVDGGAWVLIGEGLVVPGAFVDTMNGIANTNEYRVTAISDTPSKAVMAVVTEVTNETEWVYVSTGVSFENAVRFNGEPKEKVASGREKALYHFALREKAVEFSGNALSLVLNVSGTLHASTSTVAEFEAMSQTDMIVGYRSLTGRRLFCSIDGFQATLVNPAIPDIWNVSFTLTEVDHAG